MHSKGISQMIDARQLMQWSLATSSCIAHSGSEHLSGKNAMESRPADRTH